MLYLVIAMLAAAGLWHLLSAVQPARWQLVVREQLSGVRHALRRLPEWMLTAVLTAAVGITMLWGAWDVLVPTAAPQWTVDSLAVNMEVAEDGTVQVTETIEVGGSSQGFEGLTRQLPVRIGHTPVSDRVVQVSDVEAADPDDDYLPAAGRTAGDKFMIDVDVAHPNNGGPNRIIVQYQLSSLLLPTDERAVMSWPVVADMPVPISAVSVTLTGVPPTTASCGSPAENVECRRQDQAGAAFRSTPVAAGQQLHLQATWDNQVQPEAPITVGANQEDLRQALLGTDNGPTQLGVWAALSVLLLTLLPVVAALFRGLRHRRGRDSAHVQQRTAAAPPPQMTADYAAFLQRGRVDEEVLIAAVLAAANRGVLRLRPHPVKDGVWLLRPGGREKVVTGVDRLLVDHLLGGSPQVVLDASAARRVPVRPFARFYGQQAMVAGDTAGTTQWTHRLWRRAGMLLVGATVTMMAVLWPSNVGLAVAAAVPAGLLMVVAGDHMPAWTRTGQHRATEAVRFARALRRGRTATSDGNTARVALPWAAAFHVEQEYVSHLEPEVAAEAVRAVAPPHDDGQTAASMLGSAMLRLKTSLRLHR